MTTLIFALLILLVIIIGTERFYTIYVSYKNSNKDIYKTKLDVLKIISKHECHKNNDFSSFENWISKVLQVFSYNDIYVTAAHDDGGKDVVCIDKDGNTIYVECKLWKPENFEEKVGRSVVQKLAGAMLGDNIKKGLIITTSSFTEEAKEYVRKLPKEYEVRLINGDELMEKLYQVRKLHLEPLLKPIEETL